MLINVEETIKINKQEKLTTNVKLCSPNILVKFVPINFG